jgi:CO/xanthine dehydrogenase FAD-binding subunit
VAATPIRLDAAAEALIGSLLFDRDIADAVHAAVASIEIMNSPHASDGYRRRAAATLAVRALTQARHTARGNASDTVQ